MFDEVVDAPVQPVILQHVVQPLRVGHRSRRGCLHHRRTPCAGFYFYNRLPENTFHLDASLRVPAKCKAGPKQYFSGGISKITVLNRINYHMRILYMPNKCYHRTKYSREYMHQNHVANKKYSKEQRNPQRLLEQQAVFPSTVRLRKNVSAKGNHVITHLAQSARLLSAALSALRWGVSLVALPNACKDRC